MKRQLIRQLEIIQEELNIPRYEKAADQTVGDDTGGTQHTQVWKGSRSDSWRWYRRDSTYPGMKRQQIRQLEMIQEGLNIPRYEKAADQTVGDDTRGTQHTQVWIGCRSDNYRWDRRDSTYPSL
jgi:hypothetical protein